MTDVISSNTPVAAKLDEVAALGERAECVMLNTCRRFVE